MYSFSSIAKQQNCRDSVDLLLFVRTVTDDPKE